MSVSGKSVLWFLAGCMAFTDAVIGVVAGFTREVNAWYILAFAFLSLAVILVALVSMYWRNPQLLIAEQADLVPLAILEKVRAIQDPVLLKQVISGLIFSRFRTAQEESDEEEITGEEGALVGEEVDEVQIEDDENATLLETLNVAATKGWAQ